LFLRSGAKYQFRWANNEFKQTEKYAQLLKMVKIIPQHVDKIVVQRNTQRLGYLDILAKECEKEDESVREALQEVLNDK